MGKGRKQRSTPLTSGIIAVLRVWLAERAGQPTEPLFTIQAGMALSRDALEHRLAKYVEIAARTCPSLGHKTITMHVLRHTAAMRLLRAGIDTSVIALWLGHEQIETTQIYLHADLQLKNALWPKQPRPTSRPAATGRLISFSPFSRRSDYADPIATIAASGAGCQASVGIIRRSA